MKNPLLLKAKFEAGTSLRQLITEQNHEEVLDLVLASNADRKTEYIKEILPRAYRNETPKLRFLHTTGMYLGQLLKELMSVDSNESLVIVRPNIVRSITLDFALFNGMRMLVSVIEDVFADNAYAHLSKNSLIAQFLMEVIPEETTKAMESPNSLKGFNYGLYMELHKLVFPDDIN